MLVCADVIDAFFKRMPPRIVAGAMLLASLGGSPALSQPADAAAIARPPGLASEIKAYVTAPSHAERAQWVWFGAAIGAAAFAYQLDDDVRAHFGSTITPAGESPDTQDAEQAMPAALVLGGTWLAAVILDDADGRREARSMLQAVAFSGAAALLMKEATGRLRPYETEHPGEWGSEGDSFPSMQTTAAFAIGTVLAESGSDHRRWLRRALGYGVAAWTAYARMDRDAHWFSDTVVGASLGIATARFVTKRQNGERRSRLQFSPTHDGVQVSYTIALP